MTDHGIEPGDLSDDGLTREMTHLHDTRHDAVLSAPEDALETHTTRMLALEGEFIRRFPDRSAIGAMRTRAGSRRAAHQAP
jgi:hypothetical protein